MTTLSRNEASVIIRHMSNPRNIRELSRALLRLGANRRIKENAAKRVVGIRVSELYRRRKAAMLNWARKFNGVELQRLLNLPNLGDQYERRINSIPHPPRTRTNLIKAVIARYIIATKVLHRPNAVRAVRTFHNVYGRPVQNRIPNAQLVNFVIGLPSERLRQFHRNLPTYL
jgi:hypothetical protein